MSNNVSSDTAEVVPFSSYVNAIRTDYQNSTAEVAANAENQIKHAKKIAAIIVCCALVACGAFAFVSHLRLQSAQASFDEQMSEMRQNFQHVESYNSGDIVLAEDFVTITKSKLTPSREFVGAVDFDAAININSDVIRLIFTEDTKYVVIQTDGSVKEYDMFEEGSPMNVTSTISQSLHWYGPVDFGKFRMFDLDVDSVSYIKLKNVSLSDSSFKVIKDDLEIELYSAD